MYLLNKKTMKQLAILTLIFLFTLNTSAQTEKGTVIIEGGSNLNLTSTSLSYDIPEYNYPDVSTTLMEFTINGGYFVIDRLAIGLTVEYNSSKIETEGSSTESTSTFIYGALARYYIGESGVWSELRYALNNSKLVPDIYSLTISVGYALYLGENVSFNPSLGYSTNNSSTITFTNENGDFLGVGESITNGLVLSTGIAIHF
jgi:hypothetical protein